MPNAVFKAELPHARLRTPTDRVVFTKNTFASASPSIKTIPGEKGKDGRDGGGFGWTYLADTEYDASNQFAIQGGQRVLLPNNGGAGINNLKLMYENHDFIVANRIRSYAERDSYSIRIDFIAESEVINNELVLEVDIGGGIGTIQSEIVNLGNDAGTPKLVTVNLIVYALDTFLANGAGIFIRPSSNINIYKSAYLIRVEDANESIL